ncbi:hypothetical protein [Acetobacter sp.]|uniref:hypothetical protein n=1 Tax=Acetobacter sp. TaxID=440 RepID=UPI0039E995CE
MKVVSFLPALGRGCRRIALPFSCALLMGCQHRDLVDTTLDWYHQHQGGIIAQQRPPAPGQFDPYPNVGLTPTTPPELPSPELRQQITNNLIADRNLTMRTAAQNGTLTPDIPPPPNGQVKPAPAAKTEGAPQSSQPSKETATTTPVPQGGMGAILDAADSSSTPPAAPQKSSDSVAKKDAAPAEAEIGMPEFTGNAAVVATTVDGPLPEIPAAPPALPSIAGVDVPVSTPKEDAVRPDYDLSQKDGTLLNFAPGSDQLAAGEDTKINKIVSSRRGSQLFLHCSGETVSMSPEDQTRAVQLGLLRCRTLSDALTAKNVPASVLHISSSAFGPAARVSTNG